MSIEQITAILALLGTIVTGVLFLWRIFKHINKFTGEQEKIKECLKIIKQEVTPNGGKSIKDTINNLKATVDRIEKRQKISDQRTKASLHHIEHPLFETDKEGRLHWYNEAFKQITLENGSVDGHDWLSIVDEEYRQSVINEVKSCLRMCRKIDIETISISGKGIRFIGYPYKIDHCSHEGFLIHLYISGDKK
jgi:transcriptional regulator with PAS, ATPase and Fis domain